MRGAADSTQGQLERYQDFYKQDPENRGILYRLIDLETQLGSFDTARTHLGEGLKKWQQDPELQFREATLELASGNITQAASVLQDLLDAGVDNSGVRYNLGYAYLHTGDYGRAKLLFESIENDSDELPELPLLRSRALHHLGDVGGAVACASQYLETHPDNSEVLGMLGLLYLDKGEQETAQSYALNAYHLDSGNKEALVTLGSIALEALEAGEAQNYFTQAVEKYPESGRAWSGVGLTHMLAHDLDEARQALEQAVRYMPGHIGSWHALAWCQIVQSDLDAAEASFNSANEVDHNFGETHGGLAVIAAFRKDWEKADRTVKLALRLDPESFSARFAQSLSMAKHDPEAAQAIMAGIMESSPTQSGQSLQTLVAQVFSKRGATTRER